MSCENKYNDKPFQLTNATYIPNQLFDTRCKFLTNQQKIFLIYLYRRLYGYGKTETQLSYSVIFNDFPCIIKNKQKFSGMITDLQIKGLIKIKRGVKKSNTYIIEKEQYDNLVFWGVNHKGGTDTEKPDTQKPEKILNAGFDISSIDLTENTIETLQAVYQYEYKKIYPQAKNDFRKEKYYDDFFTLVLSLNDIPDIDYTTFIRSYFLNDFDDYSKPSTENIYDNGISNYKKYKNIIKQVPLQDNKMLHLFVNVYDSGVRYKEKSIEDIIDNHKLSIITNSIYTPYLLYCSKKYNQFCNEKKDIIGENIYEKMNE